MPTNCDRTDDGAAFKPGTVQCRAIVINGRSGFNTSDGGTVTCPAAD